MNLNIFLVIQFWYSFCFWPISKLYWGLSFHLQKPWTNNSLLIETKTEDRALVTYLILKFMMFDHLLHQQTLFDEHQSCKSLFFRMI